MAEVWRGNGEESPIAGLEEIRMGGWAGGGGPAGRFGALGATWGESAAARAVGWERKRG